MRALRSLALGLAVSAIWPTYLVLLAYTARQAPWPRSVGILVSAILSGLAITVFAHEWLRWLTRPDGWAECHMMVPRDVARQLGRAGRFAAVAAAMLLLPVYLFDNALIAPEGRALHAQALCRFLIIAFELVVFGTCFRLLRGGSPLMTWLTREPADTTATGISSTPRDPLSPEPDRVASVSLARLVAGLRWLSRGRRVFVRLFLVAILGVIVLDVRGYSFTAKRLAMGWTSTMLIVITALLAYRAAVRAIETNAWRLARPRHLWAVAFTSAMGRRASARAHLPGLISVDTNSANSSPGGDGDDQQHLKHLTAGLQHIAAFLLTAIAASFIAWAWDLDLALVRFLLARPIWSIDETTAVTFGDLTQAAVILALGLVAWRNMNTLFSLAIFSRIPDDPGVRFAIVTLCRYAALGLTTIAALSSVHLDMAKISVVLAALGVGLGFGLQEIVSNFVCGIILLLERPIRIGDIVTVGGTTGTVDRINIRATTIINSDNQCMIVPNREFITGNLVNWTHKDKILRVSIKLRVAYGTDPDRVVELLSRIARLDDDVLFDPLPSASLEGFGDSALMFALYVFVADPSLAGPVRHRLCSQIHRKFEQEKIVMPFPTQQLFFDPIPAEWSRGPTPTEPPDALRNRRVDSPERMPTGPHAAVVTARTLVGNDTEPA